MPTSITRIALAGLALTAAASSAIAQATPIGPSPYLSASDSPFNGTQFTWFHRLTGETGAVSVPGIAVLGSGTTPAQVVDPGGLTDSVDGDDGVVDGIGCTGHSYFTCPSFINIVFDASVLGSLPTHAGVVWTDGNGVVTVQAFDAADQLVGAVTGSSSDGGFNCNVAEDRFYGFVYAAGIRRITVADQNNCIEVDHIQAGRGNGPFGCGPADLGRTGGAPGADGLLNNNDFVVFIDYFFGGNPLADRGGTGGQPGGDGQFNNNDFIVFIDQFFAGC